MAEAATFSEERVRLRLPTMEVLPTLSGKAAVESPSDIEWHELIDRSLIAWGADPDRFRDEGLELPSATAIVSAAGFVGALRDSRHPLLPRLLMSGEGGIVFEWALGGQTLSIEITRSGAYDGILFEGCRVVQRF